MNLALTRKEKDSIWRSLYKKKKEVNMSKDQVMMPRDTLRQQPESISYYDLLNCFRKAGLLKFDKTVDKADILTAKFRSQMKKLNYTADKLYKAYDPKELRYVYKHDFIDTSMLLQFQFSDDEFLRLFEIFCCSGLPQDQMPDFSAGEINKFTLK